MILGDREIVMWGSASIEENLLGLRFQISAKSFYQINPVQTEVLYTKAIELAGLTGEETVIDVYCGTGTIGLSAARKAKRVIGIEIVPSAVEDAKKNAVRNGIANAEFICGDAGVCTAQLLEREYSAGCGDCRPAAQGTGRSDDRFVGQDEPEADCVCFVRSGDLGTGLCGVE